jgi:DNA-directed RNA polymerase, mitochondrial
MKEQLLWEQECLERGMQSYFTRQDKTREKGNDLTDATTYILRDRLMEIAANIKDDCKQGARGSQASYNKLVRQVAGDDEDYTKVGFIGLQYLLIYLSRGKKVKVAKFVSILGSKMEAELKCKMFEAEMPAYFNVVMQSFEEQGVSSAVHKQKALMKKFGDFELNWTDWTTQMKVHSGTRVFRNILKVMGDLIFLQKKYVNGKTDFFIDTTVAFDDWVAEFEKERGLLYPMHLPLKRPPVAWESQDTGAYYTPAMKLPFIKSRGRDALEFIKQGDPAQHRRAVNKMQRTAWAINVDVLKVQQEIFKKNLKIGMPSSQPVTMTPFPEHLENKDRTTFTEDDKVEIANWKTVIKRQYSEECKRKGKVISFRQSHLLAQELATWDELYFAYNCDFRGRIYCATAGLSPQGADDAKGLLRFAKGVQLGLDGVKWLAIQGANTYGEDKVSYEDRVQWVKDSEPLIRAIVEDPINNRMWGDADKPYQFLAFCFEWAKADYGRDHRAVSYIPVGLDGSCNGLQHFSAMLRDEVGARATNLIDSDKPQDIYGDVAKVAESKLQVLADDGDAYAKVWLQVGIDRTCAKRPVMTLPYGATQQSTRSYILDYVTDNWAKFNMEPSLQWEMTKFLTPILWESIGEVVIAARAAMDWLKKNVGANYCHWTTVIGFPVYQHYRIDNLTEVKTYLEGVIKIKIPDMNKGTVYKYGQRSGIAPNFVHSIDSTHMVLTVNATDFNSYAMIHDDFGTHAGNTQQLFKAIRKTFRHMYANTDPLRHWAKQVGVSTAGLPRGNYNIEDVTNAKYFFG